MGISCCGPGADWAECRSPSRDRRHRDTAGDMTGDMTGDMAGDTVPHLPASREKGNPAVTRIQCFRNLTQK
jgi:hypothetical protein